MKNVRKNNYDLLKLLDKFIMETHKGKRLQKNGKRIRLSTVTRYISLRKLLYEFSNKKEFPLHISSINNLKKRGIESERKYWKLFYMSFTDFLYNDKDFYDNYVGGSIKQLRTFFNYLNEEKGLNVGSFHKRFYVQSEEIAIITLLPEQLNFLIYDVEFEKSLPDYLRKTKDIFVFGCTVALRISDLFKISNSNIEVVNNRYYLKVVSQKTNTFTRVLLPEYAVKIINKSSRKQKPFFNKLSFNQFNLNIKQLIRMANWTKEYIKIRHKRGIPVAVYKNKNDKTHYLFCDHITSHTMRRTAITTMLCLNMPENVVRKISGHAPNSVEFFRYVQLSQKYMDVESEKMFDVLKDKTLMTM